MLSGDIVVISLSMTELRRYKWDRIRYWSIVGGREACWVLFRKHGDVGQFGSVKRGRYVRDVIANAHMYIRVVCHAERRAVQLFFPLFQLQALYFDLQMLELLFVPISYLLLLPFLISNHFS